MEIFLCRCGEATSFSADDPYVTCRHCCCTYDTTTILGQSVPGIAETDPHGTDPHAPGAKLDAGKPMTWLCISGFSHALTAVADVTTKGAVKYTPSGWEKVPDGVTRYMDAFARHALALGRGEEKDPDTGCLHKAQMIWNLLASLELELRARG